jgi:RNA recognition motif-containing protein
LTNYELDVPPRTPDDFDDSLPGNHYDVKHREQLRVLEHTYTVRIDDLHPSVSKEQLEAAFSVYGEVARVYLPVDLANRCTPKGFAFVRFVQKKDAERAAKGMDGAVLGQGRCITVRTNFHKSYFSQDESPAPKPKKKPGVVMHFDP